LEAFSDGVIAIIITIMVLELKLPHNPTWQSYLDSYPIFAGYALSFVFVGLYWNSHHHLFHIVSKVHNKILWVNMFALFWLSLIPFCYHINGRKFFYKHYRHSLRCYSGSCNCIILIFSKSIVFVAQSEFRIFKNI